MFTLWPIPVSSCFYGSTAVLLLWLLIIAIIPNHSAGLVNSISFLGQFHSHFRVNFCGSPVTSICSALILYSNCRHGSQSTEGYPSPSIPQRNWLPLPSTTGHHVHCRAHGSTSHGGCHSKPSLPAVSFWCRPLLLKMGRAC